MLFWRNGPAEPASTSREQFGTGFASDSLCEIQQLVRAADQKAAIFLTLAAALLGVGASEFLDRDGLLHDPRGLTLALAIVASALLTTALLFGLAAVFPRTWRGTPNASNDLLFFGALRDRDPADVARDLRRLTPQRADLQLAAQLVAVSKICWRKHAFLRVAILALGLGAAVLTTALIMSS